MTINRPTEPTYEDPAPHAADGHLQQDLPSRSHLAEFMPHVHEAQKAYIAALDRCTRNCIEHSRAGSWVSQDMYEATDAFNTVLERAARAFHLDTRDYNSWNQIEEAFGPRAADRTRVWFQYLNGFTPSTAIASQLQLVVDHLVRHMNKKHTATESPQEEGIIKDDRPPTPAVPIDPAGARLITKFTQVLQRADGSEVKLVAERMFGAGLHPSDDVTVFHRSKGSDPWRLCSDRPDPNWRQMSVDEYIRRGRAEKYRMATHGEIFKVGSMLGKPMPTAASSIDGTADADPSASIEDLLRPDCPRPRG